MNWVTLVTAELGPPFCFEFDVNYYDRKFNSAKLLFFSNARKCSIDKDLAHNLGYQLPNSNLILLSVDVVINRLGLSVPEIVPFIDSLNWETALYLIHFTSKMLHFCCLNSLHEIPCDHLFFTNLVNLSLKDLVALNIVKVLNSYWICIFRIHILQGSWFGHLIFATVTILIGLVLLLKLFNLKTIQVNIHHGLVRLAHLVIYIYQVVLLHWMWNQHRFPNFRFP